MTLARQEPLSLVFFSHTQGVDGAGRSLLDLVRGLLHRGAVCNVVVPAAGPLQEHLLALGSGVLVAPPGCSPWQWGGVGGAPQPQDFARAYGDLIAKVLPQVQTLAPDFIISQTIVSPWGLICANALNVPHALSAREYGDLDHGFTLSGGFREAIADFYQSSNIVFSVTQDVARHLFGADADHKVEVIYSNIEADDLFDKQPSTVSVDSYFRPGVEGPVVCLAGTFIPGKGQKDLIRATIALREAGHAVRCLLIGVQPTDSAYVSEVRALIADSVFQDSFAALDFTPSIYALLRQVDVIVSCSRYEALGRTLIEASLLDKPIVYTNSGGWKEVFEQGVHGLAYESGEHRQLVDCLLSTIKNSAAAQARVKTAKAYCESRFSSENYAGKVYGKLKMYVNAHAGQKTALPGVLERIRIESMQELVSERDGLVAERNGQIGALQRNVIELQRNVSERSERVGELQHMVVDRDQKLVNAYEVVAERVRTVSHLTHAVAERDAQIASLGQEVAERDGQIASLGQEVAERDGQIASLGQATAKRDDKIGALSYEVTVSHERAAHLMHAVAERDGQIASLGQAVADRDVKIGALSHEVTVSHERAAAESQRLHEIFTSKTWRLAVRIRRGATAYRHVLGVVRGLPAKRVVRSLRARSEARLLRESGLFDGSYYLEHNPDVRTAGVDPAQHYLVQGWRELRDPSQSFSTAQYLSVYPDVALAQTNPLMHYLRHGQAEGRAAFGQVTAHSISENAPPSASPVEIPVYVEEQEADVAPQEADVASQEAHNSEEIAAIAHSGLFDISYYLSLNPELLLRPEEAIRHYCEHGWREGRNPSSEFDTRYYLDTYADIRQAGINPFWHYAIHGAKECRNAAAPLSNLHEEDIFFGAMKPEVRLIAFYKSSDWAAVRDGRPRFKGHAQPIVPREGDPGFYDPLNREVLTRQAEMARRHGIEAFCFDLHAERGVEPIDSLLEVQHVDIRFCVNIETTSRDSVDALTKRLAPVLADQRYLRFATSPVIVVTVVGGVAQATAFLGAVRQQLAEGWGKAPYLIGRYQAESEDDAHALATLFSAALDLPASLEYGNFVAENRNGVAVVPYNVVAASGVARLAQAPAGGQVRYPVVALARDNSATRAEGAVVYTRFDVKDYRRWLDAAIESTSRWHGGDPRIVFVDAWNDWNEGVALEPDQKNGFSRLNETSRALAGISAGLAMPKVTVIVPNYNHEPFLRRRLNSIYGQTYKNIEVLLLDDCSPDQSRTVLDEYAGAYPEITRKFYNEVNSGGVFRQWAKGIESASGKLVWIAESDDYCDEHFLERLVRSFDDETVLLAYGFSSFVDRDEKPLVGEFHWYVSELENAEKWQGNYVETAHNEVRTALGIKNTIPNASSVVFRRPIDMPLLQDESWLSMRVAGDWVFYLHLLRGGKIAYRSDAINFFRRYPGSTADTTYKKEIFYREVGQASRTVAELYDVPLEVLERCRKGYEDFYWKMVGQDSEEFLRWYDYLSVLQARQRRVPNVMITTMGFSPGGAEILPIRIANELKRQGHSVLLLNTGLMVLDFRIREMVRNDVPVVEVSDITETRELIRGFGIEALNSHQWHIQKYPAQVADVFDNLRVHVASLHGMIEHDAFGVTDEELFHADEKVTTWVYTANKNVVPFAERGLYDEKSDRFTKIPNGMMPVKVVPVSRSSMNIPDDAFVLCCVSRAIPDKGWAETIAAVAKARELSNRDIRLILVGNGPVYDEYCQKGVEDFVYLAGFSENSVGHYASADMGIMLTKFRSESFPLTIVDCLFAGKPYIATDVGDIRNMLTEGQDVAGAVVELEDWEVPVNTVAQAIAAFASEEQKFHSACVLVKGIAARYRIDMVTSRYVELYVASRGNKRLGAQSRVRGVIAEEF